MFAKTFVVMYMRCFENIYLALLPYILVYTTRFWWHVLARSYLGTCTIHTTLYMRAYILDSVHVGEAKYPIL